MSYAAYNAALIQHNILVKAKNFLVFQADVEAVASQSPKELARLIDQISGSLELAPDYEKARDALERATENATFNFTKRRGMMGEIKQYKEQKGEAERFEQLCQERVRLSCLKLVVFVRIPISPIYVGRPGPPADPIQAVSYPAISRRARAGHSGPEQGSCGASQRAAEA